MTIATSFDLVNTPINFNTIGDNIIVPAIADQVIRVRSLVLSFHGDVDVIFKSGATTLMGPVRMFEGGSLRTSLEDKDWLLGTITGQGFIINLSSSVTVGGSILYSYRNG